MNIFLKNLVVMERKEINGRVCIRIIANGTEDMKDAGESRRLMERVSQHLGSAVSVKGVKVGSRVCLKRRHHHYKYV